MKEQFLLDYLQDKISVEELAADLKGSQKKTGHDVISIYIDPINLDGNFEVTREHLLRLCNEALNGKLLFEDLNTIAFAILSSDYFTHDQDNKIIDRVLFDWDNPEIGWALTAANMKKWKQLLEDEVDTFGQNE